LAWFPQIHKSHHNNKALVFVFRDKVLVKEAVAVDSIAKTKTEDGFGSDEDLIKVHFHSAARESGFILFKKASRVRA